MDFPVLVQAVCEVRPRLGAANVFIKGNLGGDDLKVQVNDAGDTIIFSIDNKGIKSISWPVSKFGKILSIQHHHVQGSCETTLRLRLAMSFNSSATDISVMKSGSVPTIDKKFNLRKPCMLDNIKGDQIQDGLECSVQCVTRSGEKFSKNFTMKRMLPLPTLNWRELSPDWFCACFHGAVQHGCSSDNDQESGGGIKNKQLGQNVLGPRPGDVLYSHAFVVLNSDDLNLEHDIGESDSKANALTLWHHETVITETESTPTAEETFLLLIGGLVENSPSLSVKILLEDKESDLVLDLWIMDSCLKLVLLSEVSDHEEKTVMKVLFKKQVDKTTEAKDHVVKVPKVVLDAGLDHLKTQQKLFMTESQKQDGQYSIAYIDLAAVRRS